MYMCFVSSTCSEMCAEGEGRCREENEGGEQTADQNKLIGGTPQNHLYRRPPPPPPSLPQSCISLSRPRYLPRRITTTRHHDATTNQHHAPPADLAAQLAAGLGLRVVAPPSASPRAATEEAAATAAAAKQVDTSATGDDDMMLMEEEERLGGGAGARLGGWFDDGKNASRRERMRAIRREEKGGKSPEKVRGKEERALVGGWVGGEFWVCFFGVAGTFEWRVGISSLVGGWLQRRAQKRSEGKARRGEARSGGEWRVESGAWVGVHGGRTDGEIVLVVVVLLTD